MPREGEPAAELDSSLDNVVVDCVTLCSGGAAGVLHKKLHKRSIKCILSNFLCTSQSVLALAALLFALVSFCTITVSMPEECH